METYCLAGLVTQAGAAGYFEIHHGRALLHANSQDIHMIYGGIFFDITETLYYG